MISSCTSSLLKDIAVSDVPRLKVVLDESGLSKGYGFVRYGSEVEQQHALDSMTGEMGLGNKPIKVSLANQKTRAESRGGGGLSPTPGSWGGVSAWPPQTSGGSSGWPGSASGQGGETWSRLELGARPSSVGSGATSPGGPADYGVYHEYYQQYA